MKTYSYILILWFALAGSCFAQGWTYLYNINETVPADGQSLSVTLHPGIQFTTNSFYVTLTYALSGTKGSMNSLEAVLSEGGIEHKLIKFGDDVTGQSFVSEPIYDFLGSHNKNWRLIVTDRSNDNLTMYLSSIRLTIPEPSAEVLLFLGVIYLFVVVFGRKRDGDIYGLP